MQRKQRRAALSQLRRLARRGVKALKRRGDRGKAALAVIMFLDYLGRTLRGKD